ncbi:hypothetical protein KFL_005520040 [Klebsormidium nitens]|uniref:Alpha-2-macroglobulin domain-containing protein n=1 Tax=Klebsormidium nitens TaxID=105231 RepID=A0A1Y1IM69_KLENI|nr:hypothetical protein KFL_005520040 [Klebsormidium nitens]|eukprot:GAQ89697.1 hypothetical protein KFL_005520040 [Klebsormidium nitens]
MAAKGVKGLMNRWGFGSKAKKDEMSSNPEPQASGSSSEWKEYAECLTSDSRWSTHISTDKPIYRPGDTVHIRAVVLHPITGAPVSSGSYGMAGNVQVLSPKGSVEATLYTNQLEESVAYASWAVPEGQAGGEYTLKLEYGEYGGMGASPPAERKIQIRNFRSPKLNVRVEFLGRGYSAGDEVKGKVSVTRAEGGAPPAGTPVSLTARVDGTAVHSSEAVLDDSGVCYAGFALPPEIAEGLGALTAVVHDGGNVESGSKTIPIVLQTVDVKLFPEGGVLVPGLENRVYFEARDPTEEPLDVEGEVWPVGGNAPLATFAAVHEGRGKFVFTPAAGQAYEARFTKPGSVKKPVPLPEVEGGANHGLPSVVLRVEAPADGAEKTANSSAAIDVTVGSTAAATLRVALYKREVALESKDVNISAAGGTQTLSFLLPGAEYSGVLRVTVFAESSGDWTPVVERLIFRAPVRKLHVAVSGGPAQGGGNDCVPGGRARVEVAVTDAVTGEVVSGAVVGVSVVDNSNLEQVEPRRRAPRLPAMALLEDEVDHLEDHAAYIDGSDLPGGSDPSLAVDLLLGTQGWRRFLYRDPLEKLVGEGTGENGEKTKRDKFKRAAGVQPVQPQPVYPFQALARGGPKMRAMNFAFGGGGPPVLPQAAFMAAPAPPGGAFRGPPVELMMLHDLEAGAGDPPEPEGAEGGLEMLKEGAEAEPARAEAEFPADDLVADVKMEVEDAAVEMEVEQAADAPKARKKMAAPKPVMPAAGFAASMARPMPVIRVYAHTRRKQGVERSTQRSDFTETVYFAASLVTDARGRAAAEFDLSDSITSFAVTVDAHKAIELKTAGDIVTTTVTTKTKDGAETTVTTTETKPPRVVRACALGASDGTFKIRSVKPFYVDAKCPLELTTSDRVLLPVTLVNAAPDPVSVAVQVGVKGPLSLDASDRPGKSTGSEAMDVDPPGKMAPNFTLLKQSLEAASSARRIVPIVAGGAALDAAYQADTDTPSPVPRGSVTVNATASVGGGNTNGGVVHRDNVKREFAVSPKGFPQEQSAGGMLKPGGGKVGGEFALPEDTQPGSVVTSVTVFPSPVASLTQALEALIREPYGCFEQTSATVYPNIMAQQYFKTHSGVSPQLMEKSYKLLGTGLDKLRSFEVKGSGGYEWFGSEPAHEALTAYGLLEFVDMAQVYPVPEDMIRKTRAWLLGRRDAPARAFHLDPKSLDSFGGAPADVTNAYIVWSLTYAKLKDGLEQQIASLVEQTATNKDPYFVGLVAGTLYNVGRNDEAAPLARGLEKFQKKDGSLVDARTSITRSGGDSLLIETTAVAVLCWLNEKAAFGPNIRRAVEWLATRCKDGKFGSTQATVLALKAIIAYDVSMTSARAPGKVHLLVDGARVESVAFDAKTEGAIVFKDVAARLTSDGRARKVELEMEDGAEMPYAIQIRYHSERPSSAAECAIGLSVALQQPTAQEGDLVEILMTVENKKADEALPMTVAILGLPGGLEPRHDQLRELVTRGDVAFYELRGRDVIFYWRTLAAGQKVTLRLEASAAVPGEYVGPASRAYMYYTDELKTWTEPIRSVITPKTD